MADWRDSYEPVDERLAKWWAAHPEGRVETHLVSSEGAPVILFRAEVYRQGEDRPAGVGYAHQRILSEPPKGRNNKPNEYAPEWTSPWEVAETSAVGRALANAGYAPRGARPSREELRHVPDGPAVPEGFESTEAAHARYDQIAERVKDWTLDQKQQLAEFREMAGIEWPWPAQACDMIEDFVTGLEVKAGEIEDPDSSGSHRGESGEGGGGTEKAPGAGTDAEPSPPSTLSADEEELLAASPCHLCSSTRTKRVVVGGKVRCSDAKGCERRAEQMEDPF